MVYSMSRNRYCERIGRQHKSNHVIYVVDLRRAVFYQKCHDPDCRGYRSPLRPIPMDVIPNTAVLMDSVQTEHHVESTSNHLGYSLVENDRECVSLYNDKSITDSCKKDAWWLEAIRFADNVESVQHMRNLSDMENIDDEDDDWWMAAERTASQTEQTYFNHKS